MTDQSAQEGQGPSQPSPEPQAPDVTPSQEEQGVGMTSDQQENDPRGDAIEGGAPPPSPEAEPEQRDDEEADDEG